jgi:hypothetical protein
VTPTQRFILATARDSKSGMIQFGAGDRKGTRIVQEQRDGTPLIYAYGSPEYFMQGRWLDRVEGQNFRYRINAAGREAIGTKDAGNPVGNRRTVR